MAHNWVDSLNEYKRQHELSQGVQTPEALDLHLGVLSSMASISGGDCMKKDLLAGTLGALKGGMG